MRMQVLAARAPIWAAAVEHASQLINGPDFQSHKRTMRTVAGFALIDGTRVFVKRVDEGSWLKGWILRLRGSRWSRVSVPSPGGDVLLDGVGASSSSNAPGRNCSELATRFQTSSWNSVRACC